MYYVLLQYLFIYLSNTRAWLLDHLTPSLQYDVIKQIFIESSALWSTWSPSILTCPQSRLVKPVEVYSQKIMFGVKAKMDNGLGSLQGPQDRNHSDQRFLWLPKALGFWVTAINLSMYVDLMLFALRRVKDWLRRLSSLLGLLSYCRGSQHDLGLTVRGQFIRMK
ncbi:hypothetical protein TNCV_4714161 [Trichonephila clavipes]|nr:hypothetical protein TNCV_4714161 [Trichonephila clavipes]